MHGTMQAHSARYDSRHGASVISLLAVFYGLEPCAMCLVCETLAWEDRSETGAQQSARVRCPVSRDGTAVRLPLYAHSNIDDCIKSGTQKSESL